MSKTATIIKTRIKAFSILELLLAIILTVIVVLTAAAAIRGISRSRNTIENYDKAFSQAMFFMDSLAVDLSNVYSPADSKLPLVKITVTGDESQPFDRISFLRVVDPTASGGLATVAEVEYGMLKTNTQQDCLGRRIAILKGTDTSNKKGRVFVLSDAVKSLKFEIYDGKIWQRASVSGDTQPLMVRVTLATASSLWSQETPFLVRQIPVYPCMFKIENEDKTDKK